MKKIISVLLSVVMVLSIVCGLAGCGNKRIFDTTYTFDTAIIYLPDGTVVKGEIDSWTDYEDGDQIQVVMNGVTYLVHSTNIVLVKN